MTIAVCDDDEKIRKHLVKMIRSFTDEAENPVLILEFSGGEKLLACEVQPDIVIMDIGMGGMNGMETAAKLRKISNPILIFVTALKDYVFDAFDVGAFQYLLKPVSEKRFAQVFELAVKQILTERVNPQRSRVLTLQAANINKTVPLDDIFYVESSNHKVVLHLQDGEFAYYAKIRDLELELQDQFFRIHKGYLVNLSYVAGYSKTEVMLVNGEKLLLSKYKYKDFVKAYLHFLQAGAGL